MAYFFSAKKVSLWKTFDLLYVLWCFFEKPLLTLDKSVLLRRKQAFLMQRLRLFLIAYLILNLIALLLLFGLVVYAFVVFFEGTITNNLHYKLVPLACLLVLLIIESFALVYSFNKIILYFKHLFFLRSQFAYFAIFNALVIIVLLIMVIFIKYIFKMAVGSSLYNALFTVIIVTLVSFSFALFFNILLFALTPRFNFKTRVTENQTINLTDYEDVTNTITCEQLRHDDIKSSLK